MFKKFPGIVRLEWPLIKFTPNDLRQEIGLFSFQLLRFRVAIDSKYRFNFVYFLQK